MGYSTGTSLLMRSPKREEQRVPEADAVAGEEMDVIVEELEGIFCNIKGEEKVEHGDDDVYGGDQFVTMNWEFMDWEEEEEDCLAAAADDGASKPCSEKQESTQFMGVFGKKESVAFWEKDEHRVPLNLNLNYQDVLDAWSDRGSLWANDFSLSIPNASGYTGEVPVMMEEERSSRREASVLRYKEKRQTRLFSKKIRYQVRKLNADKRPRLKGRFVKRVGAEKTTLVNK
ncbi:protein CHLOROPLAST IMPORT APPARATUS 2 isoform X2 [Malania oleifera]|uniref:protein CHLOROPLAST IMPORT APPARATUS 2 isoform X2 n=1 Tax=Malania oleifera TaxID=397392 RepID=UPI0025AE3C90|nr:protein CHLOROPLAST IMPORT APPARATUS 2 isoform X2 [Malania oleifera]